MIHQLQSDIKNEIRSMTTVIKNLDKLILNHIETDIQKQYIQDKNNFLNDFKKVINKITENDVYQFNKIIMYLTKKITEFRCMFNLNISILLRTDMVKELDKTICQVRISLNELINEVI